MRQNNNKTGANQPTLSKVGIQPIKNVAAPIIIKETKNEYFLPIRSPILPKINDPIGRNINDETTTASVSKKCDEPSLGNNCVDNTLAKMIAKNISYHSIKVPTDDAKIIWKILSFFATVCEVSKVFVLMFFV